MLRTKTRKIIIGLIAAFSVAGLAAVPAGAAQNVCNLLKSGQIECHPAKQCVVKYANGTEERFNDGDTIGTPDGKTYECKDGKWQLAAERGGRPPAEPPKNAQEPGSTSSGPSNAPPPAAGSHP